MGVTIRPSSTALAAAARAMVTQRDTIVSQWEAWTVSRLPTLSAIQHNNVSRQLRLLFDILATLTGPTRRRANELWLEACEWYGRTGPARGLATGEIVEEFHYLRELLIRELADTIAALPARQSLATVLRLNRELDHGVAHAVVGYTDALVETLLNKRGVPVGDDENAEGETANRLDQWEDELAQLRVDPENWT